MRVANVVITGGEGIAVTYSCLPADGRQCGKTVCICLPGRTLTDASGCPDRWAQKHENKVCTADDAKTSLVVYPEAAPIRFTALGNAGATADVK